MSKEGWNAHTDKNGKEHADYYDKNPRESDHSSVHITIDSENEPHVMLKTQMVLIHILYLLVNYLNHQEILIEKLKNGFMNNTIVINTYGR